MNRDKLTTQVKDEYARLASSASQQHFSQTTGNITAEDYYGNILNLVEKEIDAGTFDGFKTGHEIVEAVAKDKQRWLPGWKN